MLQKYLVYDNFIYIDNKVFIIIVKPVLLLECFLATYFFKFYYYSFPILDNIIIDPKLLGYC